MTPQPAGGGRRSRTEESSQALSLRADPATPRALLLAWRPEVADVLRTIVAAAPDALPVYVVAPADAADTVRAVLADVRDGAFVVPLPVGSPWMRDFGPLVAEDPAGRAVFVDARYDPSRPEDDALPNRLAARWGARVEALPLVLEGGNLVADGHGACFLTRRVLAENPTLTEEQLVVLLDERVGCRRVVFLPRLRDEPTGHADLLVAFVAGRALVAASQDPRDTDALASIAHDVEAAIGRPPILVPLARTVRREVLSFVQVVALGDRLLVPRYEGEALPGVAVAAEAEAWRTLAATFPERRLVPVPLGPHVALGGGVRCFVLPL